MIQPLRRRHFPIWVALSVCIAALFTAGLIVRQPTAPPNRDLHWGQYP